MLRKRNERLLFIKCIRHDPPVIVGCNMIELDRSCYECPIRNCIYMFRQIDLRCEETICITCIERIMMDEYKEET